jgi:hypothetical protein
VIRCSERLNRFWQRRGFLLGLVLMGMILIAGLLTLLATSAAHRYRVHRADRTRIAARAASESAAAWARANVHRWAESQPVEVIELDVSRLIPPQMSGQVTIDFPLKENRRVCRVSSLVTAGPVGSADEVILELPSASSPAGP